MSFVTSILAAKAETDVLLKGFGLSVRETVDEMPFGDWWATKILATGWSILWVGDSNFGLDANDMSAELSKQADVLHCFVDERTNSSMVEYWTRGESIWQVSHLASEHPQNLDTIGDAPPQLEQVREKNVRLQAGDPEVDYYFSIPVELSTSIIGFEYPQILEPDEVDSFRIVNAVED